MKIDRLLSIIIYLLNRDLVSARELSDRYGVSTRTIQRDMETIELAGVPIMSIQGPYGGYGILDSYKMDRRLVDLNDLHYIITALKGIGTSIDDERIDSTIEKFQGLVPDVDGKDFSRRSEKLQVDFSMLGGNEEQRQVLSIVQQAVDSERLLKFKYTNNKLKASSRTVEPMTLVFKWRAWYLYAYCRLRQEYRIFRASKILEPEMLVKTFSRREKSYAEFETETGHNMESTEIDIKLRFSAEMKPIIDDYYRKSDIESENENFTVVKLRMPETGWLYGYILSFGHFVEVLEPEHLRKIIADGAEKISEIYRFS